MWLLMEFLLCSATGLSALMEETGPKGAKHLGLVHLLWEALGDPQGIA